MMKGINRNVIELTHLDSKFFDRAVLILKSDCADPTEPELVAETRRTIGTCKPPSFVSASKVKFVVSNLISGTAGALISAAIFAFILGFV